ncbi:hypothetical protein E0E53_05685 [Azotobacter chroococcum]|nr:hypothetical protein E0E53_05685 [Azotobacter chroococcum]
MSRGCESAARRGKRQAVWPGPAQLGRSLPWYPLVGLLLGILLVALHGLLGDAPALLLAVWVGLSGALHLDGLYATVTAPRRTRRTDPLSVGRSSCVHFPAGGEPARTGHG